MLGRRKIGDLYPARFGPFRCIDVGHAHSLCSRRLALETQRQRLDRVQFVARNFILPAILRTALRGAKRVDQAPALFIPPVITTALFRSSPLRPIRTTSPDSIDRWSNAPLFLKPATAPNSVRVGPG